jgi:fructuronate reductase
VTAPATTRLSRSAAGARPAAPVRIVHLGLGNFFRAHQAWYTDRAPDAHEWGIAAFTGRSPAVAEALAPQDGLYTLVTRGPDGDTDAFVASLSAVHASDDHQAWLDYLGRPEVGVVTLTVTEAGYQRAGDGALDLARPDVADDVAALRRDLGAPTSTIPARLVGGLAGRRSAGAGPIAVVPNDNLPHNGAVARRVVLDLAGAVDAGLARWVEENVSFVSTMVDRITPRATDEDRRAVLDRTGLDDRSPVVTEPFTEWVLAGDFPAGRPAWDASGAQLVGDVTPFEDRKLWLLNGAHSLLAYAGSIRGHETVAEAVADAEVRSWVEQWWDEAAGHLRDAGDVAAYRSALLERFANPQIRHLLAQIAADGSQKLPVRVAPTLRAERGAGRMPRGAVRVLAAWLLHLQGHGAAVSDAHQVVAEIGGADRRHAAKLVVEHVVPDLADDEALVDAVVELAEELTR